MGAAVHFVGQMNTSAGDALSPSYCLLPTT
jgi:hypothetical protein